MQTKSRCSWGRGVPSASAVDLNKEVLHILSEVFFYSHKPVLRVLCTGNWITDTALQNRNNFKSQPSASP